MLKPSRLRNTQVVANFANEMIVDFSVPWNGAASARLSVAPPRVAAAFAEQHAAMSLKVRNKIAPFHTVMGNSS
jgi:hypothetical protein